jgi:hypothetical protein
MTRKVIKSNVKEKILGNTDHKCAHCGRGISIDDMTVEHIFPVSKGGNNNKFNLVALCPECNYNKSNEVHGIEYYKHIKEELFDNYALELAMNQIEYRVRGLFQVDIGYRRMPNRQVARLTYQMAKRGDKRDKIKKIIENSIVTIRVEKASREDADKIVEFLEGFKNDNECSIGSTIYSNKYQVINAIEDGCGYTYWNGEAMCGVAIMEQAKGIELPQLKNMEEQTLFDVRYILSTLCINKKFCAFDSELSIIIQAMLAQHIVPVVFVTSETMKRRDPYIELPYKLGDADGKLLFPLLDGLRDLVRTKVESICNAGDKQSMDKEQMDKTVEEYIGTGNNVDNRKKKQIELERSMETMRIGIDKRN